MSKQLAILIKNAEINKKSISFSANEFEQTLLTLMFILLVIGIILFKVNYEAYRAYVAEDSIIEWLTVIALFSSADVSIKRALKLRNKRNFGFIAVLILFSFAFIFGAGEEISWGQRIFGLQSSNFFLQHNLQHETNIHNLVLMSIKINKVIFSFLLGFIIAIYFLVVPILYQKKDKVKKFIDFYGIPVPRIQHVVSYLIFSIIIKFFHAPDKWELLEMAGSFIFYLILLNPLNLEIYNPDYHEKDYSEIR